MGSVNCIPGMILLLFLTLPQTQQPSVPASAADDSGANLIQRIPPPPENASAKDLEDQGDTLRSRKLYLDSVDYYRAAIKKSEANAAVLHNKAGISLLLLGRNKDAKKEFKASMKLDKTYPEAYNNLGALYYNMHRWGSAIKQYKKAIQLDDASASFHSNLGTAYFSQKHFDRAVQEYQRAMELDPEIFDRQASGGVTVRLITSNELGHFHYVMAQMYGSHGNAERCRYYLSKANEEGYPIRDALRDKVFAGLRKDPSFVAFVRSLKPPSADSE
jgi:tetratricopeptide (TPR) repeat protein